MECELFGMAFCKQVVQHAMLFRDNYHHIKFVVVGKLFNPFFNIVIVDEMVFWLNIVNHFLQPRHKQRLRHHAHAAHAAPH